MRFLPDKFTSMLIATILLASFLPVQGVFAEWFGIATKIAVGLLFFLHGARLSREAVVAGVTHWRLHLAVVFSTFVLFPILGVLAGWTIPGLSQSPFYLGILYLCVLPSTVQSSIAFTSMAGGNVAAAVVSASASNILGMFLTPLLVGLLFAVKGGGGISVDALESILLQLLAPFLLGQILQPWIGNFMRRHGKSLGLVDRGSILMVVYLAFSEAVVEGLWQKVSWNDLGVMIGVSILLLVIVMLVTWYGSKWLGFNHADRITIMFCGSKKSLASGAPMASAIFVGADVGSIVLPLMLFHQIQLMACAVIARKLADHKPVSSAVPSITD
ncbi:bile acid:sodium symporter family protein [Ochrobactrum sp. Marseille-Q0166]|uniref:bile acid:sodium symporter family protein n=1 Tax=Ochrobactrum sp. Marseille-Q0166 TaxID=2761105 RepID=UPI001654DA51|nr:bile acid:sodium symporter family protein [Ochrobactrum sp. Marseille-Q0166]MBC8717418.1 bile acid:sodium symporter [Ochrobactrum sp. Marseille-Q0166]